MIIFSDTFASLYCDTFELKPSIGNLNVMYASLTLSTYTTLAMQLHLKKKVSPCMCNVLR